MPKRIADRTHANFGRALSYIGGLFEAIGRSLERGHAEWLPRYGYLIAARIDLAFPRLRLITSEPFNGQVNRVRLFHTILDCCAVSAIIETGTFRGTTTEYMARHFRGRIYTCEVNPRYFEYAKRRLADEPNVEVCFLNSERLLEQLFREGVLKDKTLLYYLDAHWNTQVPLLSELSLIFESGIPSVVMIDDFEVPSDQGYGYDTFGAGKKLCLAMLKRFRAQLAHAYFPSLPSLEETRPRRGCLIFATTDKLGALLGSQPSLKSVTEEDWNFYC